MMIKEFEYDTDGKEDKRPLSRKRAEDIEPEYEDEEEEEEKEYYEEETQVNNASDEVEEEEDEEPKQKSKEFRGSVTVKEFESDEDSFPRKTTAKRKMAICYDSDKE